MIDGEPVREFEDLSARMRSLEGRYRTLIDNVDVGICIAKMKFDENSRAIDYLIVDGNPAYERHTGLYGTVGKWVSDFSPDLERHWFDTYGHVALTGESAKFQSSAIPLGNRWFDVEAHRVGDPAAHEVAILFTDVTAKRAEQEKQRLLNRELSHRLKNFVSIVQAMVAQSLRTAETVEAAQDAISGRLLAFARAQDLLGDEILNGADITDVVQAALSPHQTQDGRISFNGPMFGLSARRALGLSLALHELATNAIKYGALSNDTGTVEVEWRLSESEFEFRWDERGGPQVAVPKAKGFGSKLIETIVGANFDGKGQLEFNPNGVQFRLVSPTNSGLV